jgi:sigma-B regulation protein RsbU (phosphoserine phosphatase)
MADSNRMRESVRNLYGSVGRVGLIFAIALALFIALLLAGNTGLFLVLDIIVLAVTGIWLAIRSLRYLMNRSLWSLRNRLLTVYALTGVLPILLILVLVGLCGWALTSELAIHLASSELDRRLGTIQAAAEALEKTPPDDRKYAAPNILAYFKVRFPGIRLYAADASGEHAYPPDSPPLNLPPGWQAAHGLLERDGKFYGWSHIVKPGETITALAPLTDALIADLVPNLGQIVLTETPHRGENFDSFSFEKQRGWQPSRKPGKDNKPQPHPLAIHNAGVIPPPINRFDIDVPWVAFYPHYDWNDPNRKYSAVLLVRSRPSAVLSAIFTGTDQLRSVLVGAMIAVAILFLLVEIVALVIGVSLSRRIMRAVNELYEGTRRVIYGDFRHRIPVRGGDQIGELTTSFNQMTGNLERLLSVEKEKERLQAELEIAREVQMQLYPKIAPPQRGLRLTVCCDPARVVSGDYYDYEPVHTDKLAFCIGDVAGKGISAALLMATVQAALRAQTSAAAERLDHGSVGLLDAARVVSELNRQVYAHTAPEKYTTFFFGLFDEITGTLTYTNAGHLPPILIRKNSASLLDINGTVVGAFPFSVYNESKVLLEPGDLLICYTDGITEPENAYGEMFGEDRLIEIVKRSRHQDDSAIIGGIIDAVRNWHAADEMPDDMTLLIARRVEANVT